MAFSVKVEDHINASAKEVFNAIVSADQLTCYFASESSSSLQEGEQVIWTFSDVGAELNVKVIAIQPHSSIRLQWEASGKSTIVNIEISEILENRINIAISESSFELDEKDVKKAMRQTQGWTDFICSLKAYLYTGGNLRTGEKSA